MIRAESIRKSYGAHEAVKGLDFEIARGECLGLLGLNGAGKSTTLKMLAGLLNPTGGQLWLDGERLDTQNPGLRSAIGYLPEVPPLYGDLTVREQLLYAAGLHGMKSADASNRMREVADSCGLSAVLDVPLSTLSHGFKQRTGIAQAILHKPTLVILDEPTQGLDPMQIVEIRKLLQNLRGKHTILLSTHILTEIEAVCDRILLIHHGRIAAVGTEAELVRQFGAGGGTLEMELGLLSNVEETERVAHACLDRLGLKPEFQRTAAGTVRVVMSAADEQRAHISRAVVTEGLPLLELRTERSGLETMFSALETTPREEEVPS